MTITPARVRERIASDEPRYKDIAAELGAAALPALAELAGDSEPMIAAKAASLVGAIAARDGSTQAEAARVLVRSAQRPEPAVRAAAAYAAGALAAAPAAAVLAHSLGDDDQGVRRVALRALDRPVDKSLVPRLRRLAKGDPDLRVREAARALVEA